MQGTEVRDSVVRVACDGLGSQARDLIDHGLSLRAGDLSDPVREKLLETAPSLFINGVRYTGPTDYDDLHDTLAQVLQEQGAVH